MSENKLLTLRAVAEEKVKAYNELYQSGSFADAVKLEEEIDKAIGEYTAEARAQCFRNCKESGNPMLAAVTRLTYKTIATKNEEVGEAKIPVLSIVDKDKAIDLAKLHKYVEGGIGHDKNWIYIAEKFNCLLTAAAAIDLGIDPKTVNDSYAMSAISKDIKLCGPKSDEAPTTDNKKLAMLKVVIESMIGPEFKVTTHDLKFLMKVYTKKSRKALSVTTANQKYLRSYLAEICHKLVTGKVYDLDYKKIS